MVTLLSSTDIKRVIITSKTMVKFRHFEVEAPHGTSLTLVTHCRADKTLSARELIYRTGGLDKDSEDSALSNMQIAS